MKDEYADAALEGLVRALKRKRLEPEKCDDESNKRLEEGEKRISDVDETLRGQVLTPTEAEDKAELIEDDDVDVALEGSSRSFSSEFSGFQGRGFGGIGGFRGRM